MTPKNEKVSWKRKQKNIENLVEEIGPLEDQILELIAKKSSIMDKIRNIRTVMIAECIHPKEYLAEANDGTMHCKFCNKQISIFSRDQD